MEVFFVSILFPLIFLAIPYLFEYFDEDNEETQKVSSIVYKIFSDVDFPQIPLTIIIAPIYKATIENSDGFVALLIIGVCDLVFFVIIKNLKTAGKKISRKLIIRVNLAFFIITLLYSVKILFL